MSLIGIDPNLLIGSCIVMLGFAVAGINREGFDARAGLLGVVIAMVVIIYVGLFPIWAIVIPVLIITAIAMMGGDEDG